MNILRNKYSLAFVFSALLFSLPIFRGAAVSQQTVSPSQPSQASFVSESFDLAFSREGGAISNFNLKTKKFQDRFAYDPASMETLDTSIVSARPFTLSLISSATNGVSFSDARVAYEMREEKQGAAQAKYIFTGQLPLDSGQVSITKTYVVDSGTKNVRATVKIKNTGSASVSFGARDHAGMSLNFWANIGENAIDDEIVANFGGSLYKAVSASKDFTQELKPSNANDFRYLAVRDSYYVAMLGFDNKKPFRASVKSTGIQLQDRKSGSKTGFVTRSAAEFPSFSIDAGESETFEFYLFMGVKSYDDIKRQGRGYEDICEFNFLALLLLQALVFFYQVSRNYGVSIILLTVAIKIILQPLTNKQTRSMKEMQKIQPHINELKKKYANDMQKMNEEIMKLYKEHGVNPFGGCLPLLLQLPILFALFTALRSSVELKGEGFLWIPDLSMADPTWILPIAIAISMHLQQSQMQVDPQQAAAFQFMPIFMFFITYTLPAGVLLYWGVSNLLQIGQQWYDNRAGAATENGAGGDTGPGKSKKEVSPGEQ